MKLKLMARNEAAGDPRVYLQFNDESNPSPAPATGPTPGGGIAMSGYFDRAFAMSLEVGKTYSLSFNPVE